MISSENQQNSKNEKFFRIQVDRSLRVFCRFGRSQVFHKVQISKFLFHKTISGNEISTSCVFGENQSMLFSFFKNSKNPVLFTKQRKSAHSNYGCFSDTELECLHGNNSTNNVHDSSCQSVRVHFVQLLKCEKLNKTSNSEQMQKHSDSKWFPYAVIHLARSCKRQLAPSGKLCQSV